jgi:hypothetical protein
MLETCNGSVLDVHLIPSARDDLVSEHSREATVGGRVKGVLLADLRLVAPTSALADDVDGGDLLLAAALAKGGPFSPIARLRRLYEPSGIRWRMLSCRAPLAW